ncbi:hypothetical protein BD779DRAFT_1755590 [Infundibulicybe gibba]|nr:hypothetical protein BD779DRAFT_1755590 [Infundibulicybe gibba]
MQALPAPVMKRDSVGVVLGAFLALCLDEKKANDNIEPEDLLKKCLKAVLPICNEINSQLRFYLKAYASITSEETKRYKPFVFAFNRALEKLQAAECDELRSPSELNIMFHRNDPKYIIGTHDGGKSSRKPDVVLASLDAVRAAFRTKRDALSEPLDDTWEGFVHGMATWSGSIAMMPSRSHGYCSGYVAVIKMGWRSVQGLATFERKLARADNLDDENLRPTTSYGAGFFDVAISLLYVYYARRLIVKPKPRHNNHFKIDENKIELDYSESERNELMDISTEL